MNKTTGIIIAALVIVIGGAVVYGAMRTNNAPMMDDTMMGDKDAMHTDDADMMKDDVHDDGAMMDDDMMHAGSYEAYAPEKLARAETGDVVLFFHASWCPSCRGLNADIEKNLSMIPSDVSILKVDYDTELALKQKYGVTYQHTLVQVDASGNMIAKWSGSPTLAALAAQIQ